MSAFTVLVLLLGTSKISYGHGDIICGETSECAGQTLNFDDVFCTGTSSCTDTSINVTDDIHCDGFQSCIGSKFFAKDDVFCNGYQSCNDIKETNVRNLYCRGPQSCNKGGRGNENMECSCYKSCEFAEIAGGDVICSGSRSCADGEIDADNTITCDGSCSCAAAKRIDSWDDIYCRGWFGCDGAEFVSTENDLRCESGWSCRDTELEVTLKTSCNGRFSCLNTKIRNGGEELDCFGQNSCETANIQKVQLIKAFGFNSLKDATIYNREEPFIAVNQFEALLQTMKVEVKGHQAGDGAEIYCYDNGINENDCEIECQGNGCNGLTVFCESTATCVIECTNADCPITQTL